MTRVIKRPAERFRTSAFRPDDMAMKIEADQEDPEDLLPSVREDQIFEAKHALKLLLEPSFYGAIAFALLLFVTMTAIKTWAGLKAIVLKWRR